jgi:ATP-dependent Clp protease adaptor protein ClpS
LSIHCHRFAISVNTLQPSIDQDTGLADWQVAEASAEVDTPYDILVHNDDITPMDFVVAVLMTCFDLDFLRANRVMLRAHQAGVAYVATFGKEEAKYRVGQAHESARIAEFPLQFTIQPS